VPCRCWAQTRSNDSALPSQTLLRAAAAGYFQLYWSEPILAETTHVSAAALKVGAQVIVTSNLKDFRTRPDGIETQSPDEFLANLFDLDGPGMAQVVLQQARALKRPPRSVEDVLRGLAKSVPTFAASVSEYLAS
jgi:hypothetical protein